MSILRELSRKSTLSKVSQDTSRSALKKSHKTGRSRYSARVPAACRIALKPELGLCGPHWTCRHLLGICWIRPCEEPLCDSDASGIDVIVTVDAARLCSHRAIYSERSMAARPCMVFVCIDKTISTRPTIESIDGFHRSLEGRRELSRIKFRASVVLAS